MENIKVLSPIAKVITISALRQDKNGRNYKVLRLEGLGETTETHGGISVRVKTRTRAVSMTQYEQSYLNDQPDVFYNAKVGEHVAVEIHQASNLEPYEITNQEDGTVTEATSDTFPVMRGDNPITVMKGRGRHFAASGANDISNTVVNAEAFSPEEFELKD